MDVDSEVEHAVSELEPGGRLLEVRALTGGVSADVFGLAILTAGGHTRRVVFRRHRADGFKQQGRSVIEKEHGVLGALHREGFAVPEPYLCGGTGAADGPYMLMEWVDGSTDIATSDLAQAVDQMARFLVELHSLELRSLPLPVLEAIEDPLAAIVQYLPDSEAGDRVRDLLAAGTVTLEPADPVLIHGDYWPGNIMWRERDLVAVIDWEDACIGDRLADVATARVELLCLYGADATSQFTDRYFALTGDVDIPSRRDARAVWDLYVSAAALSSMGSWGLEPSVEARRRRLTEEFFEQAAHEFEMRHRTSGPERTRRHSP